MEQPHIPTNDEVIALGERHKDALIAALVAKYPLLAPTEFELIPEQCFASDGEPGKVCFFFAGPDALYGVITMPGPDGSLGELQFQRV